MAEPTAVAGFSHVAMCVSDLDRSLAFYRDLLGLRVIKDELQDTSRASRGDGLPYLYRADRRRRRIVYLRVGAASRSAVLVITDHPGEQVDGAPITLDELGLSHVSFRVADVEAVAQRLLAHGAAPCAPLDAFREATGRLRTAFFRDRDGIIVQFDAGIG
ncbi:MAG: VOC family protein [Chloroflexi bacterium]|nr:VOC family protein [Chloroflexota bacterium]